MGEGMLFVEASAKSRLNEQAFIDASCDIMARRV